VNGDELRLSDVERERAAADLGEHFAQGRLTAEEHADRLDRIWAARTRGELRPLFADLPGPHTAPRQTGWAQAPSGRGPRPHLPIPLFVILAVLIVLSVATHLPLILAGLLVWFFVMGRHRRRAWSHQRTDR
jgi:hypothetical protein